MSGIKLYFKYFSIHLRSVMQYKTSFLMTVFGQFLTSFASFLSVFILMNRFSSVYEFTIYEVLLCYSAVLMSFSLAECFFRGFDSFASIIGNGEFERMLTRPRSLVLQVVGSKIEFSRIGRRQTIPRYLRRMARAHHKNLTRSGSQGNGQESAVARPHYHHRRRGRGEQAVLP